MHCSDQTTGLPKHRVEQRISDVGQFSMAVKRKGSGAVIQLYSRCLNCDKRRRAPPSSMSDVLSRLQAPLIVSPVDSDMGYLERRHAHPATIVRSGKGDSPVRRVTAGESPPPHSTFDLLGLPERTNALRRRSTTATQTCIVCRLWQNGRPLQ